MMEATPCRSSELDLNLSLPQSLSAMPGKALKPNFSPSSHDLRLPHFLHAWLEALISRSAVIFTAAVRTAWAPL